MKNLKAFVFLALLTFTLWSCDALTGEEVARLSIEELTDSSDELKLKSTQLDLEAGERVNLWADMNLEYEGGLGLEFQLLILKEGDTLNLLAFDAFEKDITMGEMKTQLNGKTKWRYSGRIGYLDIEESGLYDFQTLLMSSDNPSLQLKKADLVFKK